MGNTEFFRQTANLQKNFKWGDIFSEVGKPHTDEQKDKLLVSGCKAYMPKESTMLKEWEKPWLFLRFALWGILFVVLLVILNYTVAQGSSIHAMLLVVPAFVMPLTILIFFWEMNVPRNISILDLFKYVMFAGAISGILTFVLRDIFLIGEDAEAWIAGPIPEEIAKFILVYLIIKKRDDKYILNGLLIGCAVGAGFAAQESAGYAVNQYVSDGFTSTQIVNVLRGLLALGGHSVWASMYGAALTAAKKEEKLKLSHIGNKLVLLTFLCAVLLHLVWNFDLENIFLRFLDVSITYSLYEILQVYYGKYIILTVIAWAINFKLLRKGLIQVIEISAGAGGVPEAYAADIQRPAGTPVYAANAVYETNSMIKVRGIGGLMQNRQFAPNSEGKITFGRDRFSTVQFPEGTRGISGKHCEIKIKEGVPVLIDRGSTYGTYMADGTKLEVNRPYRIYNGMIFYLATPENKFEINI